VTFIDNSNSVPLRVAHVNLAKSYRGGERQTELLIRELARRGVRQVLIARRSAPLAARLADVDLEIRCVNGPRLGVACAARSVDVVHVHEGRSVYGAYLRSIVFGTPYIVTRRVDRPIGDHVFAHAAYRRAACVAAVAPQVEKIVRAFDPKIRTTVIFSSSSVFPVDAAKAAEIRARFSGKIVVGHVAALDIRQKAQEHIISVARKLASTHPEVAFVIVGAGADEAALKAHAAGLPNVTFTGFVDNVGDHLAAFDIFILPSRSEGIGSVLLDAMDRRLPIVATRVGGVPAIVHDGVNGLLIEPDRPAELEAALMRLVGSAEERKAMGARGFEMAAPHTPAAMAARYLELYERALRPSRAPAA
jgi:glycosyltransferase involved in cell wall biosynthesis